MSIRRLMVLFFSALITIGCVDRSKQRIQCQQRGGEMVRIKGAKTSHWECVKRIDLSDNRKDSQ